MRNPRSSSLLVGVALIVFGAVPACWTLQAPPGAETSSFPLIFGAIPMAIGLALLFRGIGPWLAAGKFGVPVLTVSPESAAVGDTLTARVALTPTQDVVVESVTFTLVAFDVTDVREDESSRSRTREQETEAYSLDREVEGAKLTAGKKRTFKTTFRIEKVWPSVGGRLRWAVRVHIAYAGYPDYHGETPTDVE